ncbi:MAG: B12-binding domain-containing radical SAM protein [Elusimicrobia bacterium]|nr:B12-binding domain-containing radical SAM protein [Elusimicrobiota bacterium]
MKILFLYWNHPVEPLGLMYLSSVLKRNGHQTKLAIIGGKKPISEVVAEFQPNMVAASGMTGSHIEFMEIVTGLKKEHSFLSVMGGSHPTFHPEVIEEYKDLDIVVRGEAEKSVEELVNGLQGGSDVTHIPNLWVRKNGQIFKNEIRDLNEGIDDLPFPDRDLVYEYPLWEKQPIRHFIACRGCAYRCTYCFNNAIVDLYKGKGMWVRWRSPARVVQEVKDVIQKYGGKFVYFQDDIFIMDKKWLKEFSNLYKREVGLPFHCHVRPNLVDEPSAKLLKDAGCYSVHMALETADDELRKLIERDMPKETILNASRYLNQNGIKIMLQNILGLPTSTLRHDFETLEMNIACQPLYAWCSIFQPYPGLELTRYAQTKGLLEANHDQIGQKFFESSILKIGHKKQREFLQKWFAIAVAYPFLYRSKALQLLISMPDLPWIRKFYHWAYDRFRRSRDNQLYGLNLDKFSAME